MLGDYKLLIVVITIVIGVAMIWLKKKRTRKKELEMVAEDKLRDEALNRALANDLWGDKKARGNIESLPYEVDYNQSQLHNYQANMNKIMLQITACSELSKRKFMIELKDVIKIGQAKENVIIIKGQGVLPVHCEMFRYNDDVYIKDYSGNRTLLNRKKQQVYVDEKGIKLKTGDKIIVENTTLEVTIVDKQYS